MSTIKINVPVAPGKRTSVTIPTYLKSILIKTYGEEGAQKAIKSASELFADGTLMTSYEFAAHLNFMCIKEWEQRASPEHQNDFWLSW